MRIFLAAPLFSESERRFNADVAARLRAAGFKVWLAQEVSFIQKGSPEEKKSIFNGDVEALRDSDVVLAILDGIEVDPGVAFEMGCAYTMGKPIFGLKTDYRTFSPIEEINLMLEVPLRSIFKNVEHATLGLKAHQRRLLTLTHPTSHQQRPVRRTHANISKLPRRDHSKVFR